MSVTRCGPSEVAYGNVIVCFVTNQRQDQAFKVFPQTAL